MTWRIIRIGLGLTFIGVGFFVLQDPQSWGSLLQPWALNIVGSGLIAAMIVTAIADIIIGVALLAGVWIWLAALLGVVQLVVVFITSGINSITIRDVGLLFAMFALMLESLPPRWRR
ncbi:MAG TPA: DoxX family membrane protein [Candidatus Paceibacterota bacterium]|nr:DoxX family membrane protein [Candidatus Paceibacterota bacterium]